MSVFPDARFLTSAHLPEQFFSDTGAEVAFAGRSNAGKSSAINAMVNRRGFARTSKSPGRTQLINFFELAEDQRLVDLPGYGYARVAKSLKRHWHGLMAEYFNHRESLAGLILVVDVRRLLGDFDWQMVDWGVEVGCPVHVLLTKADKLKRAQAATALVTARQELAGAASLQLFSATKLQGIDMARKHLQEMLAGSDSESSPVLAEEQNPNS